MEELQNSGQHKEFDPLREYRELESRNQRFTTEKNGYDHELLLFGCNPDLYQSTEAQKQLAEIRARRVELIKLLREMNEQMEFLRFKSPELQTYLERRERPKGILVPCPQTEDLMEESEEGEQSEALLSFPAIAWRGPFEIYRDAMRGTTEASDVHHFAAFWTVAAARLQRRVRMSYGMTLYPNVYLVAFGPTVTERLLQHGAGSLSCLTGFRSKCCKESVAVKGWATGSVQRAPRRSLTCCSSKNSVNSLRAVNGTEQHYFLS